MAISPVSGGATVVQAFLDTSPTLSSTLSTSAQAALGNAPPADVVQFSQAALQLQEVTGLLGSSSNSDTDTNLYSLLQSLISQNGAPTTAPAETAAPAASASQLAVYESYVQEEQAQGVLGPASSGINLLG